MVKRGDVGVHLATLNLFRESDGSVQLTVASGLGALRELEHADGRIGGLGEPANFRPVDYVDILAVEAADNIRARSGYPIPMVLHCPSCGAQHIDEPDLAADWANPPHTSHKCVADGGCGCIWRPCDLPTMGVASIKTSGKNDNWRPFPAYRRVAVAKPGDTLVGVADDGGVLGTPPSNADEWVGR